MTEQTPICGAVSEHGDVCVRQDEHNGLCQSVGRRHASSPEKAGKPWRWYRSADVAAEPIPGSVAASALRPDMVVTCPTWLNGAPVRIVTAHVGAGQVAIRYRDVRAHHADVQVKVPLDFAVTPGCGFVDGAR